MSKTCKDCTHHSPPDSSYHDSSGVAEGEAAIMGCSKWCWNYTEIKIGTCTNFCSKPKENPKSKGKNMKLLPKILRRIIVVWCLYGVARLCILMNPHVLWIGAQVGPDNSQHQIIADATEGWSLCITAVGLCLLASYGIHCFSSWLFNEK